MAALAVTLAGATGSIGFRIAEMCLTDLPTIAENYIEGRITFDEAIEQVQKQLPLHMILTTGKLISDVATVGSIGYWIYKLINSIGSCVSSILSAKKYKVFINELANLRAAILRHFNIGAQECGINFSSFFGILQHNGNVQIAPGLVELGGFMLSIFGWVVSMIKKTGSFFWTEILKYFLVAWAAFQTAVSKWCRGANYLFNIWRRIYPKIEPGDIGDLFNRVHRNLRLTHEPIQDIPIEDNQIPNENVLLDLNETILSQQEDIVRLQTQLQDTETRMQEAQTETEQLQSQLQDTETRMQEAQTETEQLQSQLREIKTRLQQIQTSPRQDLSLTLEEINSGVVKEIDDVPVHVYPGCLAGTEIPVYPEQDNEDDFNNIPIFIVRIQELPHPLFQRETQNLIHTATVDWLFVYQRQRRTLLVPSINPGSFHEIEFAENETIQDDTQRTIPLAGLPHENNSEIRGDLIIKFKTRMPTTPQEFLAIAQQMNV